MRSSIIISEVTTLSEFASLEAEWNELVESLEHPTPFLTWEWMWHWLKWLRGREELAVLLARENDRLVAVAPFILRTLVPRLGPFRLRFLGSGVTDELDFIGRELQENIIEDFLTESHKRWKWNLLDLHEFPETSPSISSVQRWAKSFLHRSCQTRLVEGLRVPLPPQYDLFSSTLSSRMRAKVRKAEERMLERFSDVTLRVNTSPSDVSKAMEDYLGFQTARWSSEPRSLYHERGYRGFLKDVAIALAGRGYTRIFQLSGDDEVLGIYLCFQVQRRTLGYGIAVGPGYWHLEVGFQLIHRVIRAEIERGQKCLDFLRGVEQYKARFGAEPKRSIRLRVTAPRLLGPVTALFRWAG